MSPLASLHALDQLLRGKRTPTLASPAPLATGALPADDSALKIPLRRFLPAAILLGAVYGVFVGLYALGALSSGGALHLLSCTVKLPLLFLLTLLVTFPSLYVFAALAGLTLGFTATLRLLVAAVTVNLTVGASLGPILGFFTLSTSSYPFIVLLNVAILGLAGVVGAAFLLRALRTITIASLADEALRQPAQPEHQPASQSEPSTDATRSRLFPPQLPQALSLASTIFTVWIAAYALVGLQMAWILRPFIGAPGSSFTFLRPQSGNVFESLLQCFQRLF